MGAFLLVLGLAFAIGGARGALRLLGFFFTVGVCVLTVLSVFLLAMGAA